MFIDYLKILKFHLNLSLKKYNVDLQLKDIEKKRQINWEVSELFFQLM